MYCTACGNRNLVTAKFCTVCGQPSQNKTIEATGCPGCGAEIGDSAKFCTVCGNSLSQESTEVAPGDKSLPLAEEAAPMEPALEVTPQVTEVQELTEPEVPEKISTAPVDFAAPTLITDAAPIPAPAHVSEQSALGKSKKVKRSTSPSERRLTIIVASVASLILLAGAGVVFLSPSSKNQNSGEIVAASVSPTQSPKSSSATTSIPRPKATSAPTPSTKPLVHASPKVSSSTKPKAKTPAPVVDTKPWPPEGLHLTTIAGLASGDSGLSCKSDATAGCAVVRVSYFKDCPGGLTLTTNSYANSTVLESVQDTKSVAAKEVYIFNFSYKVKGITGWGYTNAECKG